MEGARGHRLGIDGAAALAGAAFFVAWLWVGPHGAGTSLVVQTLAPLVAAACCWRTASARAGRGRLAWSLLGAGAGSWALGNAIWSISGQQEGASAAAAVADGAFLLLFPLGLAGLLAHPAAPRLGSGVARLVLDGLIAGGSIRFVAWLVVLRPLHEQPGAERFQDAAGFAQAVGDFVLVTVAVLVAVGARAHRRPPLVLIALAFMAVGAGDGFYTYQVVEGRYRTGSLVDVLWVAGFLALAVAAHRESRLRASDDQEERVPVGGAPSSLTPTLFVVPAFALGVRELVETGSLDTVSLWNALALVVLVLVRQMVERGHSASLVRSLQQTVEELRDREDQLAEAQRIARLGSWEWDLVARRIRRSDEVYRTFGVEPGTAVSDRHGMFLHVHPDDRERVEHAVARALETGDTFEIDVRAALVEGRIVHARGRVIRDEDGRPVRIVGTVQDVTTIRRLARELQHRLAELERSNADLANFASVTSHDLAAPVQLLLGHLTILGRRVRDRGDRADAELVEGAIRGAKRLEGLIRDILAYSLATSGEHEHRMPVDTGRVARDSARMAVNDPRACVEFGRLPVVEAHPGQMRQLFTNLLSNAQKFVPAERAPQIRVWAERVEGAWRFSVADNGVGIPDHERDRIFQMFHRADGLGVDGNGIGLAICHRIVSGHGGRLWAAPNPDGGSVFSFTIPLSVPAALEEAVDGAGA